MMQRHGGFLRGLRGLAGGLLMVLAAVAGAREISPGDTVEPREGRGLVAIAVEAALPVSSLKIDRKDGGFGGQRLLRLGHGRSLRLLELPAGDYRFSRLEIGLDNRPLWYLNLSKDGRLDFKVEPGVISYAGDLDLIALGYSRFHTAPRNRFAQLAIDLDKDYPGLRKRWPLRWQGAVPDRFGEFLANELGDMPLSAALEAAESATIKPAEKDDAEKAGGDDRLPALVRELFADWQVSTIRMNPAGDMLAVAEQKGDRHTISVLDVATLQASPVYSGDYPVYQMSWAADRTLLIGVNNRGRTSYAVRLRVEPGRAPSFDLLTFPYAGWFVSTIGTEGRQAVFARVETEGGAGLYRVTLDGKRIERSQFERSRRLDKGLEGWSNVLTDRSGVPRAVMATEDGDYVLKTQTRTDGTWQVVRRFSSEDRFQLLEMAPGGTSFYATTDIDRAQTELVRVDLADGKIVQTLLTLPGIDILEVLTTPTGEPVGASYLQDGRHQIHYFDSASGSLHAILARALPDRSVAVYETSRDGTRALVIANDETNPGTYYLYDAGHNRIEELLSRLEPFRQARPVRSSLLRLAATDGTPIEAYLSLPEGKGPHPLVVMPHGGPIGVRDTLHYDPEVQLMTNRGHAVLRVNFRGSGGFGREFRHAGYGAFGTQIEDDVLSAVDKALREHPLDPGRVALRGSSYGGYSTLMGLIRFPERYRCGIATAAVTDWPLTFSSSDWAASTSAQDLMKKMVGDPVKQIAEVEAISPVYRYRQIGKPLLLAHGAQDRRVTIEHALRLRLLLAKAGRPARWLPFDDEGHGIASLDNRLRLEAAVDSFLADCLKPAGATP
ncbi:S9 family peptidase [Dokdonella koreensis]|uniref:Peptidase S9 prolyl oligopeptidase n=1 Tax=Dokdonella koreensis DS-123 TaxID=1300342 RepID=A0A160DYP4_9GAMM|nr:prolyl oligopeptidase family serine peptidase [Dokdonella koreensis]ANB19233.1 Peptidase S9 prolyl oligopeptidase [Dokdonella koreensis DS-123]